MNVYPVIYLITMATSNADTANPRSLFNRAGKSQNPIFNDQNEFAICYFDHWNLFGIWNLLIEIFSAPKWQEFSRAVIILQNNLLKQDTMELL